MTQVTRFEKMNEKMRIRKNTILYRENSVEKTSKEKISNNQSLIMNFNMKMQF